MNMDVRTTAKRAAACLMMLAVLCAAGTTALAQQAKLASTGRLINPWGQEAGPLVRQVMQTYGIEQGEVAFRDEGTWTYGSETSAVVAMETTLRTDAVLEYGETTRYGKRLTDDELHYLHIFHLTDLAPDRTYHARMTCTDRNDKKATSKDVTVATKRLADAVRIPEGLEGPPYALNKPDTFYLVTKDITAPGRGFNITASGVTLDLGGHTVVYNDRPSALKTDRYPVMIKESDFGVCVRGAERNVRLLNGTIRQGRGNDASCTDTIGFNPIYFSGGANSEIAGVTCIYSGPQMSGIRLHWCGANIKLHHNVVQDLGKVITNRHKCPKAIGFPSNNGKCYNNLVKRTRHTGIGGGAENAEMNNNEVHIVSHAVNAGGVGAKGGSTLHDNRIFGCGDHVMAIATTGGVKDVKLYNNYIWLHAHELGEIKKYLRHGGVQESIPISTVSGCRITWGCNDVEYYGNTILVTGRDGGRLRGTWFFADQNSRGAVFHDNLVIAIAEDDKTKGFGAIAGVGTAQRGEPIPIVFRNNTIVSNFRNVSLSDSYGCASNYRFLGNTFVRVGDRAGYETIGRGVVSSPSRGHVFLDSKFGGGASYDKTRLGRAEDDLTVQWTLTLAAPAGADVVIKDTDGREVFTGKIGGDGTLSVPLTQYRQAGDTRTVATPHTVTVTKDGRTAAGTVTMDGKKSLRLTP